MLSVIPEKIKLPSASLASIKTSEPGFKNLSLFFLSDLYPIKNPFFP